MYFDVIFNFLQSTHMIGPFFLKQSRYQNVGILKWSDVGEKMWPTRALEDLNLPPKKNFLD